MRIGKKEALLADLVERNGSLFFTHDKEVAFARVRKNDRGRFEAFDTTPAV